MPQITIKLPDETLEITGSDEQAEGITKWFDESGPDDVMTMHSPGLGDVWIQKRHIRRVVVNRE